MVGMRVKVELRRRNGVFFHRYGLQKVIEGSMCLSREDVGGRYIYVLNLYPDLKKLPYQSDKSRLTLFEPHLTFMDDNEMRYLGYEVGLERAWVVQEWECVVLP